MFNVFNPISVLGFFPAFQMTYDTNGIREDVWMSWFYFSIKSRPRQSQRKYLSAKCQPFTSRRKLTSYAKVINYLWATYATDNFITEVDMEIMNFKQAGWQIKF